MSWTYSGDPAYSSKDAVRFLIQDTTSSSQEMSDEEILWVLGQNSNVYFAASQAARILGARYTEQATSKSVGGLSISYAERGAKYTELADSLETIAKKGIGAVIAIYSGGISHADKEARDAETDWVHPWVVYGIHDNPNANIDPALSTSW